MGYYILGIVLILTGIRIIYTPVFYDGKYGYFYDFTEIKYIFGIGLILLGAFAFFSKIINRKTIALHFEKDDVLICPVCEKSYFFRDVPGKKCNTCTVDLEMIKGFYERHPDLKH